MGLGLSLGLVLVHWQAIFLGLLTLLLLCLLSQHVRDVLLIIVLEALGRGTCSSSSTTAGQQTAAAELRSSAMLDVALLLTGSMA